MPKRSAEQKIERYKRKIKKLESSARKKGSDSSDHEDFEEVLPNHFYEDELQAQYVQFESEPEGPPIEGEPPTTAQNASTTVAGETAPPGVEPTTEATAAAAVNDEPDIDADLLTALGESTCEIPEFGAKILQKLADLWLPLLKKGLTKEAKEAIVKEYQVPENCQLLLAPKLNPEISAAVPDMVRNRDKGKTALQQQLGLGITAINKGLETILKNDNKVQATKFFSDACRILCDLHNSFTANRIKLLTPSLDKSTLNVIQDQTRDETLFGSQLAEKLKAAKAIERQGQQIKKTIINKNTSSSHQSTGSRSYQGNWSGPPRYPTSRGGRGGGPRKMAPPARRPYPTAPNQTRPYPRPRAPAPTHH